MLTIRAIPGESTPRLMLRSRWWTNLDYMMSGFLSILFAVPIAMTFGEGLIRVIGVMYATLWTALLLPSFFVYGWMIVDAIRLFQRKSPTLLLTALRTIAAGIRRGESGRHSPLGALARLSLYANPITNIATTLTTQALRWRAEEMEAAWREIVADSYRAQITQLPERVSRAALIASPVLERSSPEFACV